jgi:ketosteroid isomerase-like protein
VVAGEDLAFAYGLLRCGTPEELEALPERRLRLTMGLRKVDGQWTILHEHHSFTARD